MNNIKAITEYAIEHKAETPNRREEVIRLVSKLKLNASDPVK